MSDPIFKLQLLARAELALSEIHVRRAAARSGYMLFAAVLGLIALAMLNMAAYLMLEPRLGAAGSALTMSLVNAIAVVILLLLSGKVGPSQGEERMARELRELAYREVSEDVEEVKARIDHLVSEVSAIGENVGRATSTLKFLLGLLKKGER
jgi:tetrahydromethanopterin S-methyltransferase subunit G